MANYTQQFNLKLPFLNERYKINDFNSNFSIIDEVVGKIKNITDDLPINTGELLENIQTDLKNIKGILETQDVNNLRENIDSFKEKINSLEEYITSLNIEEMTEMIKGIENTLNGVDLNLLINDIQVIKELVDNVDLNSLNENIANLDGKINEINADVDEKINALSADVAEIKESMNNNNNDSSVSIDNCVLINQIANDFNGGIQRVLSAEKGKELKQMYASITNEISSQTNRVNEVERISNEALQAGVNAKNDVVEAINAVKPDSATTELSWIEISDIIKTFIYEPPFAIEGSPQMLFSYSHIAEGAKSIDYDNDSNCYIGDNSYNVFKLSATGSKVWTRTQNVAPITQVVAVDRENGFVYTGTYLRLSTYSTVVEKINCSNGNVVWSKQYHTGEPHSVDSILVYNKDIIIISHGPHIMKINANNGEIIMEQYITDTYEYGVRYLCFCGEDKEYFICSDADSYNLYKVKTSDFSYVLFNSQMVRQTHGRLFTDKKGCIYSGGYSSDSTENLYSLAKLTPDGKLVYNYINSLNVSATFGVDLAGNIYFCGANNYSTLVKVDGVNLQEKWRTEMSTNQNNQIKIDEHGNIYIAHPTYNGVDAVEKIQQL